MVMMEGDNRDLNDDNKYQYRVGVHSCCDYIICKTATISARREVERAGEPEISKECPAK